MEFHYATERGDPPSRVRRFTKKLLHVLVPLPNKGALGKHADFLEGAAAMLGSIASILLMAYLLSQVAGNFIPWALSHHWPKGIILAVGATITAYVVVQEIRFLGWWYRRVLNWFAVYKTRRGQI